MTIVKMDVRVEQKTLLVDSWDHNNLHYRGIFYQPAAHAVLAAIANRLTSAFSDPQQSSIGLKVDSQYNIVPNQ